MQVNNKSQFLRIKKKIGFEDIVEKGIYIFQIDGLFCRFTNSCTGVKMTFFPKNIQSWYLISKNNYISHRFHLVKNIF